jgi:glucose-1-phosphate thymidylyltransferase
MMKALVLSGGKGTRLRPLTFTLAKQLIPVANKPILGYVLDQVASAGITDVGIIIAPETGQTVKDYVGSGSNWGIKTTYILQEPLGLAHAIKTARSFLGDDDFIMCLGDNLQGKNISEFVKKFKKEHLDALIILKEVEDPTRFGVAVLDKNKNILKLIEKPKKPPSNFAVIGVYFFSRKIHMAVERIKLSWRHEFEITDAIQEMVDMGLKVRAEILDSWWIDTGKKDDILTANVRVLDEYAKKEIKGKISDSTIEGRVTIESGCEIANSTIHGPSIIGKNTIVEDSSIGPYTSIGGNSQIINSNIEYSIIMDNSLIKDVKRLNESLIGKNTRVMKNNRCQALKLHVGDYSEIEI